MTWRNWVRASSLPPAIALRPSGDFGPWENNVIGPIGFQLSSAHGKNPLYRIRENLHLLVQTNRSAWLYCFYVQADGSVIRIFPNKYRRDARITGETLQKIPGDYLPFDFPFIGNPGIELVKCFATTRDVERDMPLVFGYPAFSPLSIDLAAQVPIVFRKIPGVGVSEASLVITLVE